MADIKTRDYVGTYRYHLVATWCEYCRPPCLEKTLLRPKSAILSWPLVLEGRVGKFNSGIYLSMAVLVPDENLARCDYNSKTFQGKTRHYSTGTSTDI